MQIGLVEDDALAVAPGVALAVHRDVAAVVVGRDEAKVVAHRAGKGVAVGDEAPAGRQGRKHRRLDGRDALQQLGRDRAERACRRMRVAVPLQVKTRPAGLEEAVEAGVVVLVTLLDLAGLGELKGLGADVLPVVLQQLQFREACNRQIGLGGQPGEQVHQAVDRRHEGRMIGQLAEEAQPHPAAVMNIDRARDEDRDDAELDVGKVVRHDGGSGSAAGVEVGLARWTGLEALVQPEVLVQLSARLALDDGVHACGVGRGVGAGEVGQCWLDDQGIAVALAAWIAGQHRGIGHRRHPRQAGDGGRIHAEEGHEDRVSPAEVLVGQVVEPVAVAQRADHGPRALLAREDDARAQAQPTCAEELVQPGVLLARIDADHRRLHRDAQPGEVQAGEVRHHQHDRTAVQGTQMLQAFDAHQPAQPLGRGEPAVAVLQQHLRHRDEVLPQQPAPIGGRPLRQAAFEIERTDAASRRRQAGEQLAQQPPQCADDTERQPAQQPHQTNEQLQAHGPAPCRPSGWTGRAVRQQFPSHLTTSFFLSKPSPGCPAGPIRPGPASASTRNAQVRDAIVVALGRSAQSTRR
mmetsp:Transcript_119907/g.333610  ORF Transcript_119907/g.333610 Transcript_119907/m.333610 type:complete len:578 (+) Transcript_119907:1571-3304(+)